MNDFYVIGKKNGKIMVSIKCCDCNERKEVRKQTAHSIRPYYCKQCGCSGKRNPMYGRGHLISGEKNGNFGGLSVQHRKHISESRKGITVNLSTETRNHKRVIGTRNLTKWMRENPEKFKESSRKGGVNSLKLQSNYGRISSIEQKTMDWLIKNNVQFEFQFDINHKFLYDFKIGNVLVEVNGVWFHNLPKQKEKDKVKKELAEAYGYSVIYIWEDEVHKNDFSKLEILL